MSNFKIQEVQGPQPPPSDAHVWTLSIVLVQYEPVLITTALVGLSFTASRAVVEGIFLSAQCSDGRAGVRGSIPSLPCVDTHHDPRALCIVRFSFSSRFSCCLSLRVRKYKRDSGVKAQRMNGVTAF